MQTTFEMYIPKEILCILIQNSLKLASGGSVENKSGLVKIMAWQQYGGLYIYKTCTTMINSLRLSDIYMGQ